MHRASYRIDVFLYGATTNGALSSSHDVRRRVPAVAGVVVIETGAVRMAILVLDLDLFRRKFRIMDPNPLVVAVHGEKRDPPPTQNQPRKKSTMNIMQEIKKLLNDSKFATKEKRDGVVTSTMLYSDSNEPRMEQERTTESKTPPPPPPPLPVHHQTVISSSTRRVKRNHLNSTSTRSSRMYRAIKNYVDPQRPKTDSHVTKLAKKVVPKTHKHLCKTLGGSSIHGGTANRPLKSTIKAEV
ncbi:hypothetical protein IV203_024957 [Nitzschia inconspicua]|uniref:Uncharacterized protein n=1 Tax=Nitzschia inconspicua TaxID=303405 RepID=A0A9K3KAC3_9STRA|nr:hypothetical protein IV203_024957 [Nitzschia inconspicua]